MLDIALSVSAAALATSAVTAIAAHRVWANNDKCGAHNWGEKKPIYETHKASFSGRYKIHPIAKKGRTLGKGEKPDKMSLHVTGIQTCQDCGKTKERDMRIGEVPFEAFEE